MDRQKIIFLNDTTFKASIATQSDSKNEVLLYYLTWLEKMQRHPNDH